MKETQHIEWKESWRDEYLRWLCGFANAEGGVLVIGRNDKGEAMGVKDAARLLKDIPNKVRDILGIMVDVNLIEEAGKETVEIVVEPYPSPVSYKGEYHYRSGSTKQELKGAALHRFLLRKQGRHWDDAPVPGFDTTDCSQSGLQLFRTRAANSERVSEEVLHDSDDSLLENLQLREGRYLRRAAPLLFSDQPEKFVPGAYIKIGFFVTDDDLRYQDEVHGNLFAQVEKTLDILLVKYLKAYISYEGIHRVETFLFPVQALREALLNAVVHKDYGSGIPIQISVYEHQIVVWNPGQLPQDWTLERLLGKHPSNPYNPLIANAFFRAGYIEAWGRGIEKIHRECREHDISPPVFDYGMSGLMLTFRANPQHLITAWGEQEARRRMGEKVGEKVGERVGEALTSNQRQILSLLRENPRMAAREVAQHIGISSRKVEQNIAKLKALTLLKRIGPAKGGYWQVTEGQREGT
jgi:ATP-dependent DNA helicase RecG